MFRSSSESCWKTIGTDLSMTFSQVSKLSTSMLTVHALRRSPCTMLQETVLGSVNRRYLPVCFALRHTGRLVWRSVSVSVSEHTVGPTGLTVIAHN